VGSRKSELVWDLYIVQQPSRKNSKQKKTPKATEHTTKQPNKQKAPKTQKTIVIGGLTIDEVEVIALYQHFCVLATARWV